MQLPIALEPEHRRFDETLGAHCRAPLTRAAVDTLQVNVGKRCNMACHHCHVDAGPKRTEVMPRAVVNEVIRVLGRNTRVGLVDITGGAPELNPDFRLLVTEARRLGRRVIDRCNLSVLFEPGQERLASFLAENEVHVVASLPCYSAPNVDRQRGKGAFDKSIEGLLLLNRLGYGRPGSGLRLDLVYNPGGPFLPPPQAQLEITYKAELSTHFGILFDRLLTITNVPISRFAGALAREGKHEAYMGLLVNHFNPAALPGLMCRTLVSVGWDGRLHDCDFNQMLALPMGASGSGLPTHISELDSLAVLQGARVHTRSHCFACTAGAGSSCSGAVT